MVEQITGVATALALVLTYLLLTQAMMAAVLVLARYIVLQVHKLRAEIRRQPTRPVPVESDRVGGGLVKWE
jgi:hypothetical protein